MSPIVDSRYHSSLAMVFGSTFLSSFINGSFFEKLSYTFEKSGFIDLIQSHYTLQEILVSLHDYLASAYRSEYVYKSAIANQILLGNHNLHEAVLFTEFRSVTASLDVLIVNGTTTAYEIKTELDSLTRLPHQILAYHSMFDRTYVVTCVSNLQSVNRIVPEEVGILFLNSQGQIKVSREAKSNLHHLNTEHIFMSLRQAEYTKIVADKFGYVPQVSNTRIYESCLSLFKELSNEEAHAAFVQVLHSRKLRSYQLSVVDSIANCLKLLLLERKLSDADCHRFHEQLQLKPFA